MQNVAGAHGNVMLRCKWHADNETRSAAAMEICQVMLRPLLVYTVWEPGLRAVGRSCQRSWQDESQICRCAADLGRPHLVEGVAHLPRHSPSAERELMPGLLIPDDGSKRHPGKVWVLSTCRAFQSMSAAKQAGNVASHMSCRCTGAMRSLVFEQCCLCRSPLRNGS